MGYFDDIKFINGEVIPHYVAVLDRRVPGAWSVEFMLSGRMSFGIDGNKPVVLDKPVVFWHTPRHRYQYGAVDGRGWYHHWVLMKGLRARRLVEEGFMSLSPLGYVPVCDAQAVAALFHTVIQWIKEGVPQQREKITILLEQLLCLLMAEDRTAASKTPYRDDLDRLACRIRKEPVMHYAFSVEAKRLGLSYSRFRHLFREQFERSPHDYLLHARMQMAAMALREKLRPVKQVAYDAGYDDIPQFSKLFKKKIGLSPRHYRATLLNLPIN